MEGLVPQYLSLDLGGNFAMIGAASLLDEPLDSVLLEALDDGPYPLRAVAKSLPNGAQTVSPL